MTDDDTAPPLTEAAEAIARLAQIVKDLERQLGSARDWAVALESRVELLSRLARNYHESVPEFCYAARPELTADGFTVVCSLAAEHDGGHIFAEHSPFAAALTGGEDE